MGRGSGGVNGSDGTDAVHVIGNNCCAGGSSQPAAETDTPLPRARY